MQEKLTIYEQNGYNNRAEYLENMSEWYGIEMPIVQELADLLGPTEDFDGLVTSLEDYEAGYGF